MTDATAEFAPENPGWFRRIASLLGSGHSVERTDPQNEAIWPVPAGFRLAQGTSSRTAIDGAVLELRDGQRIHGRIARFVPGSASLHLRMTVGGSLLCMPLSRIKRLTLSDPVALVEDGARAAMAGTAGMVSEFRIRFADREFWEAETKGWVRTPSAVFLYTTVGEHPRFVGTARQKVVRHLVPIAATMSLKIGAQAESIPPAAPHEGERRVQHHPVEIEPGVFEPLFPEALERICSGQIGRMANLRLGDALKQLGIVTEADVQQALAIQARRRDGRLLGQILVEIKQLSEQTVQQALVRQLGVPFVRLGRLSAKSAMAERIGRTESIARSCALLHETASTAYLAMANALDEDTVNVVRFRLQKRVEVVMAARSDIAAFLVRSLGNRRHGLAHEDFFG